jgi:hypothetical protein
LLDASGKLLVITGGLAKLQDVQPFLSLAISGIISMMSMIPLKMKLHGVPRFHDVI